MEREPKQFNFEQKPNEHSNKPKLGVPELLKKLDEMYEKEEILLKQIKSLQFQYKQLQDDKEMIQTMIMFQSNKENRRRKFGIN